MRELSFKTNALGNIKENSNWLHYLKAEMLGFHVIET